MSGYDDDELKRFIKRESSKARLGPELDQEKRKEAFAIRKALECYLEQMTWRQFEQKLIYDLDAKPGSEKHKMFRLLYLEYRNQKRSEKLPKKP